MKRRPSIQRVSKHPGFEERDPRLEFGVPEICQSGGWIDAYSPECLAWYIPYARNSRGCYLTLDSARAAFRQERESKAAPVQCRYRFTLKDFERDLARLCARSPDVLIVCRLWYHRLKLFSGPIHHPDEDLQGWFLTQHRADEDSRLGEFAFQYSRQYQPHIESEILDVSASRLLALCRPEPWHSNPDD